MLHNLSITGFIPKIHILDNESSSNLKKSLAENEITYQLVPPHLHRRNPAERAIQTFKAHIIVVICSTDPKFPACEWDRLLTQCEITLNLLRPCRVNPKISAYNAIFGSFDFNKSPLAPPGTKVVIQEKPDNHRSWAPRGTKDWCVGPALEHYRCVTT